MKRIIAAIAVVMMAVSVMVGQEEQSQTPKTLFSYPVVPDTISTLENRSNFFVTHFWDNCNLGRQITDKELLRSAFSDYVTFFRYAHRNVVHTSVSDLMNKAQSNMQNFWMIADNAEQALYSNEAVLQSDEAYMLFINAILRSSKVKKSEKERYQRQAMKINGNQIGAQLPGVSLKGVDGKSINIDNIKAATIIVAFIDPECDDCNIARLRLSTNVALNSIIDGEKLALVCIYPGPYSKEWAAEASTYSDKWIVAASEDADERFDLRQMPTIYVLDADKKIVAKNVRAEDILNMVNP